MRTRLLPVLAMALSSFPAAADLIAYWSADDGTGSVLTNDGGNPALDGVLRASAGWTADGGGHTGEAGDYALDLTGVATSAVDVTGLTTTFTELTITAWINPDVTPAAWTGLFGSRTGGPDQIGFSFRDTTAQLVYIWNGNSAATWGYVSGLTVPLNTWSFVALRITPGGATFTLGPAGGALTSATNAIPHLAQAGGNWAIGIDDCCGNTRNFDGQIDDLAIWDQALTDQQLADLFEGVSPLLVLARPIAAVSLIPALPNRLGGDDLHLLASAPVGTAAGTLRAEDENGAEIPNASITYSLVPGFGDNHLFAIGGPGNFHLVTAADLSANGAAQYNVRVRAEDGGNAPLEVTLAVNAGADSDNDGLLDAWEELYAPGNLALLSADTDHEPDGLTSGEEFLLGTDPTNPDSDHDGLDDGAEVAFGTDPLNPDTDGDSLLDGAELTAVPPTNPLSADTDGDGFTDSEELAAGTDPTDPASAPVLLLAYWPADEGNGTLVANAAGHPALDGTLANGSWGAGKSGAGGDFAVDLAGDPGSAVSVPATGRTFTRFSVTGWINGVPAGDWAGLVTARVGAEPPLGLVIRANSGELTYLWNDNNANTFNFVSGLAVPANQWTFVALVIDPEGATLYLGSTGPDAALSSSANAIPHLPQANLENIWHFGIDSCCGGLRNFDGLMDDLALWNGALSPEQIESLWNASATPLDLLGPGTPFPIDVDYLATTDELSLKWRSRDGKLYTLRSETDPSTAERLDWPVHDAHQDIAATPPENTLTIPLPADAQRFFVIEESNAPPVVVFSDDFESGQGDWTTGSEALAGTVWELGSPAFPGPPDAHSPSNCFATNLTSPYTLDTHIWLRSPAIDLTTAGGATLSYFQFYDIEETFDFGRVAVLDAADDSELTVLDATVDGFVFDWERVTRSLPAAALGKAIRIEFRFVSDEINHFAGWYIDDVVVTVP